MAANKMPDIEILKSRFYICEENKLRHKTSIGGVKIGSEVGHKTNAGYRRFLLNGVKYQNHRVIWFMRNGIDPIKYEIDHINGDKSDDSEENHRISSRAENGRNRKLNSNNALGIKGVYWCNRDKKFKSFIKVDGKKINLGSYDDSESASKAYKAAALKYFGEFVRSYDNE